MNLKTILIVSALGATVAANAQISFTGTKITQNFDSLASTGTTPAFADNSTLPGVYATRYAGTGTGTGSAGNVSTYTVIASGSNSGALYSLGDSGVSDRALGVIASGSNSLSFGFAIQNNTGAALNSFNVRFDGEQWRSSTSTQNKLDFSYSTNATNLLQASGTWIDVDSLDVIGQAPVATNAFIPGGVSLGTLSGTLNFATPLAVGGTLWVRFTDTNDVGNDAALGIDNFEAVPEPASMVALGVGAVAMLRRRKKA